MKKKILNIIPYMLGLIYLAYCMNNIKSWVLSHTDEYFFYVILAWAVAIVHATVLTVLRVTKKQKYKFYLPVFFFAIGLVIYMVAYNIPCCSGG